MKKSILLFGFFLFAVLSFNSYGQSESLLDSMYSWERVDSTDSWKYSIKYYYTHDVNDNRTSEQYNVFNNNAWDIGYLSLTYYDINDNLLSTVGQYWNGTEWVNNSQILYTYDANNNRITLENQEWVLDNVSYWGNDYRGVFTYDLNDNKVVDFYQTWLNNVWSEDHYINYTYDANNNLLNRINKWWVNNAWLYGDSTVFTYDGNNNRISSLAHGWDGNAWFGSERLTYTYDNTNNLATELREMWSTDNQLWSNDSYNIYNYDGNNNLTNHLLQLPNGNNWVNYYEHIYTYYDNDSVDVHEQHAQWNGTDWNVKAKRSYTYNWDNNVQSSLGEIMQNQTWRKMDSTYYYYYGLTGIDDGENTNRYSIYPNPASGFFSIETEMSQCTYQLFDITGKTLLQGTASSPKFTLDISTLSSGVYFISVTDGERQVNGKVVKQ